MFIYLVFVLSLSKKNVVGLDKHDFFPTNFKPKYYKCVQTVSVKLSIQKKYLESLYLRIFAIFSAVCKGAAHGEGGLTPRKSQDEKP